MGPRAKNQFAPVHVSRILKTKREKTKIDFGCERKVLWKEMKSYKTNSYGDRWKIMRRSREVQLDETNHARSGGLLPLITKPQDD